MKLFTNWTDSRGSFHKGYWEDGLFTGWRFQQHATKEEITMNRFFILPGHDLEFVDKAKPWDGSPYVWFMER